MGDNIMSRATLNKFCFSFSIGLSILISLVSCKALTLKVKNEVLTKNGANTMIQIDFETNGKADVTWCRILKSNPQDCIPIKESDGYFSNGKVSLFYFVYLGRFMLQKANNEEVLAFRINVSLKNGRTVYSHVIRVPAGENAQEKLANVDLPKIVEAPESDIEFS